MSHWGLRYLVVTRADPSAPPLRRGSVAMAVMNHPPSIPCILQTAGSTSRRLALPLSPTVRLSAVASNLLFYDLTSYGNALKGRSSAPNAHPR